MRPPKRHQIELPILSQTPQITQTDNRWQVSGDVVINTVSALLVSSKNLAFKVQTTIDFAQVTDIDTATISLILEWKRRALVENQVIKLVNLPTNLNSLTKLYGVDDFMA